MRSPTRAPSLFDLPGAQGLADSEWVIQGDELELGRRIGSGSFGEVFRAQWRHTDVAVKRLSDVNEALVEVHPFAQSETASSSFGIQGNMSTNEGHLAAVWPKISPEHTTPTL